jgi:hypothetical protein
MLPSNAVLNAEAEVDKGENARMASFVGAIAIADLVKTTLGPKGMDKILQSVQMVGVLYAVCAPFPPIPLNLSLAGSRCCLRYKQTLLYLPPPPPPLSLSTHVGPRWR